MRDDFLESNLIYASENILERRRKILRTARTLVAQHGYDGFGMRDLCEAAKVAPQTVYKAFESKERLVALSIREHFTSFIDRQTYRHAPTTLNGVIERLIVSDNHMGASKTYVAAITALHFSQTADQDLQQAARLHVVRTISPWAVELEQLALLRTGLGPDAFVSDIMGQLFWATLRWCRGELGRKAFLREKLRAVLVYAAGSTLKGARREAEQRLAQLLDDELSRSALRTKGAVPP